MWSILVILIIGAFAGASANLVDLAADLVGLEKTAGLVPIGTGEPGRDEHAKWARYLLATSSWGVISTIDESTRRPTPFGNVASFSDGIYDVPSHLTNSTGRPFFYLTRLDETARDVAKNPRASLTISQKEDRHKCKHDDASYPRCVRLTLSGEIIKITRRNRIEFAERAIFSKHPRMERYPRDHGFEPYYLKVEKIFVLTDFGGAHPVSLREYYGIDFDA